LCQLLYSRESFNPASLKPFSRNRQNLGKSEKIWEKMRRHEHTGRPLGSDNFVMKLEGILGRMLKPKKAGRPKKNFLKRMKGN
jgi:hypothetical protein